MIKSYKDIISLFGRDDCPLSKILLEIAIICPDFNIDSMVEVFRISFDSYCTKADYIASPYSIFSKHHNGTIKYFSTIVFQNIYRMIDNDNFISRELRSEEFIVKLNNIRNNIKSLLKKNYSDHVLQDKFEIISEFIELVQRKMNENKAI